ncbi:DUF2344 domain-containing protein [Pseudothermotoga sp.]|uniref:DUF2344 domain-containing protein n=1 Tax=Pseudothermotoga sp. TaxID=2033661 RepID=UPI000E9371EE|nr:DUF2344 domain-containing protein [Pseudothermotoga sp.]HBJ80671.1 hypothetical protein [Pseudothermotoga sp.]
MFAIVRYKKYGLIRFLSAIETSNAIERNLRRSGLPLIMTEGFHQKVKVSYLDPVPTGVINLALYVRIAFKNKVEALNKLKRTSLCGLYPVKLWWTEMNMNRLVTSYEFRLIIPKSSVDISKYDEEKPLEVPEKRKYGLMKDFFHQVSFDFKGDFAVIKYLQPKDKMVNAKYLYESILNRRDGFLLIECTEAFCNERPLSEILEESSWDTEC